MLHDESSVVSLFRLTIAPPDYYGGQGELFFSRVKKNEKNI
jgi:hypothetical protein